MNYSFTTQFPDVRLPIICFNSKTAGRYVGVRTSAIKAIKKKYSARIKSVFIPKVLDWKNSRITG